MRARVAAETSLARAAVMREAMRSLQEACIPAMAWKGPMLSQLAWGDPASRVFADLDLVVRARDRVEAEVVLARGGWRRREGMSARQAAAVQRWLGATEWVTDTADQTLLELHTAFSAARYPGRFDVATVLGRAVQVRVAGLEVQTPDLADTLALLAKHGTKHGWTILEELVTFARLALSSEEALIEGYQRASDAGGGRAVLLALRLVHRLFDIAPPATLLPAVTAWSGGASLEAQCLERLARDDVGWYPNWRWTLSWTERRRDRARLLARVLLEPTQQEWEAVRLPDALVGLYPVVRIVRLGWKLAGGQRSEVRSQRSEVRGQ